MKNDNKLKVTDEVKTNMPVKKLRKIALVGLAVLMASTSAILIDKKINGTKEYSQKISELPDGYEYDVPEGYELVFVNGKGVCVKSDTSFGYSVPEGYTLEGRIGIKTYIDKYVPVLESTKNDEIGKDVSHISVGYFYLDLYDPKGPNDDSFIDPEKDACIYGELDNGLCYRWYPKFAIDYGWTMRMNGTMFQLKEDEELSVPEGYVLIGDKGIGIERARDLNGNIPIGTYIVDDYALVIVDAEIVKKMKIEK